MKSETCSGCLHRCDTNVTSPRCVLRLVYFIVSCIIEELYMNNNNQTQKLYMPCLLLNAQFLADRDDQHIKQNSMSYLPSDSSNTEEIKQWIKMIRRVTHTQTQRHRHEQTVKTRRSRPAWPSPPPCPMPASAGGKI